jgi:hypothetical protein
MAAVNLGSLGGIMRFLLRDDSSAEGVLEQLAQAAFQVVEGNIPESTVEDIRVGFYVAFHQVLADSLVKITDCGTLPVCQDLRMDQPFALQGVPARSRA